MKTNIQLTAVCLAAFIGSLAETPAAIASSPFELIFNGSVANAGLLGGADVDPNGDHWLIGFGAEQRLRRIQPNGAGWSGSTSVLNIELTLFGRADDLAAGNRNLDWGGQIGLSPGALLLNPAPLTIDVRSGAGGTETITYPAGTLAFIADNVGNPIDTTGQSRHELTKKLYRFDLRQTADPTTMEPDFPSNRGFPGGPQVGQTGWADWYDVFQHVVSEQDLRDLTGSTGSSTFGRQFAWSSDGQSIYAVDSGAGQGGIYRIDPTRTANAPGGVERIFANSSVPSGSFRVRSEPAILHTSVYDYSPGSSAVGDQLLVEGNAVTGNEGGVNVFVDTGAATLGSATVLFTDDEFREFADYYSETTSAVNGTGTTITRNRSPRYISLAAAPNGDIYGYEQQTDVMFRYDTQGRFSKVASEREHNLFQQTVTGSFGNDDMSNITIGTSNEPGFEVTQLTFVDSSINAPVGILVYQPGDFDRDNDVDTDDFDLFADALAARNVVADDADVLFDMNGNAEAFRGFDNILGTPDPTDDIPYIRHRSNEGVIVDWKDVKILQQFAEFPNGDTNFDFALDFTDLDTMSANYHTLGGAADKRWLEGDFASADDQYLFDAVDANLVDEIDLAVIADAWLNDLGLPAPTEGELNGRYSGQFLSDVIAAFSGGPGVPGDANGDGNVDLLDLDILGQNFGLTPATLAQGDFNGDGSVDLLDLDILGQNFGTMSATSVPEPSTLVLLATFVAGIASCRRRG